MRSFIAHSLTRRNASSRCYTSERARARETERESTDLATGGIAGLRLAILLRNRCRDPGTISVNIPSRGESKPEGGASLTGTGPLFIIPALRQGLACFRSAGTFPHSSSPFATTDRCRSRTSPAHDDDDDDDSSRRPRGTSKLQTASAFAAAFPLHEAASSMSIPKRAAVRPRYRSGRSVVVRGPRGRRRASSSRSKMMNER